MLTLADLQPGEKLVDLGAGDGRIVIVAARTFQAFAVGVEVDPLRCLLANTLIRLLGLHERARVYYGNMFEFDIAEADVVSMYLLQATNQRLKTRLVEQLKPGARIVSRTFSISDWTPLAIDEKRGIFLYEIGKTGPEVRTKLV
ncbi:MAG: SAM-dependent methyltransferase [Anaerolineales bacterium]|nr:SAM-dependent methyltransferase [Anaerolineales bacterium]